MISKNIIAILLSVVILLPLLSCESTRQCPPCYPEIEYKQVPAPYPILVRIVPLEPLLLPAWPSPPLPDSGEVAWKGFALEVKRIAEERSVLRDARIEALEALIDSHNALDVGDPPQP